MASTGSDDVPQATARHRAPLYAAAGLATLVLALVVTLMLVPGGGDPAQDAAPAGSARDRDDRGSADLAPGDDEDVTDEEDVEETRAPERPDVLSWAPPELEDPTVIELSDDNRDLTLDQDQDYVLEMPDEPLTQPLIVWGGRNLVLIGGEVHIAPRDDGVLDRGMALKHQTGTVHIEGLAITGEGLGEGINLDQGAGAVVQLQNIRIDTVTGERDTHHADVLQTWAGPEVLRIDGLSGGTTYQGLFLLPNQHGDQPPPEEFDLRYVDIRGTDESGYMLWRDEADWPLHVTDVWVHRPDTRDPDDLLWPKGEAGEEAWADVTIGRPPDGPFVTESMAGIGYRSPGYADSAG